MFYLLYRSCDVKSRALKLFEWKIIINSKWEVTTHNTTFFPDILHFIFAFWFILTESCAYLIFLCIPQRQNVLYALIDIIANPLALKKLHNIQMCNSPNYVIWTNCVSNGPNYLLAYLGIPNIDHHSKLITEHWFPFITKQQSAIWLYIISCHLGLSYFTVIYKFSKGKDIFFLFF